MRVASFWREVFDLSGQAQSLSRLKVAMRVGAVVGAFGLIAALAIGFATNWSSTDAIILLIIPIVSFSLAAGSYLELRRLRRERRDGARVQHLRSRRAPD